MEVVFCISAASSVALHLIQRYIDRLEPSGDDKSEHITSSDVNRGVEESALEATGEDSGSEVAEGSIQALKSKLDELRNQAKQLNSPDTFVQYARVSREANKLEQELQKRRAEEGTDEDLTGVKAITRAVTRMIAPKAAKTAKRGANLMMLKVVIRCLFLTCLWFWFSWNRNSELKGEVMRIDCKALRPLEFFFRKADATCIDEDMICDAKPPECIITYPTLYVLWNTVFAFLTQALR